jgi:small ligand-binding sensory domain FIST
VKPCRWFFPATGPISPAAKKPAAGALLFSCNGRGRGLFGHSDHDAETVAEELAGAPAAGFFAAGEIGPVGGESFLHGFTATIAVFA